MCWARTLLLDFPTTILYPQIVIATPGRLNDLLVFQCNDGSSVLTLENTKVLVLDEADRMCDMGFEDDIKKVGDQSRAELGEAGPLGVALLHAVVILVYDAPDPLPRSPTYR